MSAERPRASAAPPITELIAEGVLDEELAAVLWLLLGSDVSLVVSGPAATRPSELAAALEELAAAGGQTNGDGPRSLWLLEADSLEGVFAHFSAPPFELAADQLRNLGLVLVLRDVPPVGRRLFAAHYLRPVERDAAGHLQRRPPVLLAAHDATSDRLEHFWWAVTPELADRLGVAVADFEQGQRARRAALARLVAAGRLGKEALLAAVGEFRSPGPH
ncbi:MAG TPA: hypothetical protein VMP67_04095 [Candidatus Limnocylindria bacterium]|nr:hypothetical protein [Candidatus Limnocylindria bacterium]